MSLLLRVAIVVAFSVIVLAIAYVVVTDPGSGANVIARGHHPPVVGVVSPHPVKLAPGRAVMASGPAGLWVAREARHGAPGRLVQIDTENVRAERSSPLSIVPQGIAVGRGVIWVLGTMPNGKLATLLKVDPASGRVEHRLQLAEPPSCATEAFASCYPVATSDGVWVPLLDEVVQVNQAGTMAVKSSQLTGHVWALTGGGGELWALAETAIYRIDEHTAVSQRIGLKSKVGVGAQANHVVADSHSVWVSSFPRDSDTTPGRLTRIEPGGQAPRVTLSRLYPGAGSLALIDGGLWVARFDGQGELDRLNAANGGLTGPFIVLPDQPLVLAENDGDLWVLSYRSSGNVRTVTKVTLTAPGQ